MLYVMLFCEYPFERPEDEQHPHKFQKMLERTKRLDYRLGRPTHTSSRELPTAHRCTEKICLTRNLLQMMVSLHTYAVRVLRGWLPELAVPALLSSLPSGAFVQLRAALCCRANGCLARAACLSQKALQLAAMCCGAASVNSRAVGLSCAAVCEGFPDPSLCPSHARTS